MQKPNIPYSILVSAARPDFTIYSIAICLAAALQSSSDEAQKSQRPGVQGIHRWAAQDPEAGGRKAHALQCQQQIEPHTT